MSHCKSEGCGCGRCYCLYLCLLALATAVGLFLCWRHADVALSVSAAHKSCNCSATKCGCCDGCKCGKGSCKCTGVNRCSPECTCESKTVSCAHCHNGKGCGRGEKCDCSKDCTCGCQQGGKCECPRVEERCPAVHEHGQPAPEVKPPVAPPAKKPPVKNPNCPNG